MWFVQVKCVAALILCLSAAPQALNVKVPGAVFSTKAACEEAAIELAKKWNPGRGGYAFRCRKA